MLLERGAEIGFTFVLPAGDSSMLRGLMSRWITPCWNAYSSGADALK